MAKLVRYPWDEWFSRLKPFKLRRGRDFPCQLHSMSVQLRNAATSRGMRLSVMTSEDEGVLTVEVLDRKPTRKKRGAA